MDRTTIIIYMNLTINKYIIMKVLPDLSNNNNLKNHKIFIRKIVYIINMINI
jgi:hypothetical protein